MGGAALALETITPSYLTIYTWTYQPGRASSLTAINSAFDGHDLDKKERHLRLLLTLIILLPQEIFNPSWLLRGYKAAQESSWWLWPVLRLVIYPAGLLERLFPGEEGVGLDLRSLADGLQQRRRGLTTKELEPKGSTTEVHPNATNGPTRDLTTRTYILMGPLEPEQVVAVILCLARTTSREG